MTDQEYRNLTRQLKSNPDLKEKVENMANRLGRFRQMENTFRGKVFYTSTFYPDTGTLVRATEEPETPSSDYSTYFSSNDFLRLLFPQERISYDHQIEKEWRNLFGHRARAFSPVPETLDVAINTWCNYGCSYCYTDATTRGKHASLDLIRKIFEGFKEPPYQIAYGGGSPTQHPEFIKVLELTRELGSVPNYTTEGQNLTDTIIGATSELCGGAALTFHASRGIEVFKEAYKKLSKARCQVNVHLIADKDVVTNLALLDEATSEIGHLNLVLLAYYPDVGRSDFLGLMPKPVYMKLLPEAIKKTMAIGNNVAFSEGLLPYFLSRPEIGVDTRMATFTEGRFNCFISMEGRISTSSFDTPLIPEDPTHDQTVFNTSAQTMWDQLGWHNSSPHGDSCGGCIHGLNCATPDTNHYLICRYAKHNEPESQPRNPKRRTSWW